MNFKEGLRGVAKKNRERGSEKNNPGADLTRRKLLEAVGISGAMAAMGKLGVFGSGGKGENDHKEPVVPESHIPPQEYNSVSLGEYEEIDGGSAGLDNSGGNSEEEKEQKENEGASGESKEGVSEGAKKVANLISKYYEVLTGAEGFFPKELFSDDFFISIQFQESRYKPDAVSKSGAVGIMQTKAVVIKDLMESLARFKRSNPNLIRDEIPEKLSDEVVNEVLELIKKDANLGRATGKLYFASLLHRYGVGKKEFERGDIRGAQKILAAAYNYGPRAKRVPSGQ